MEKYIDVVQSRNGTAVSGATVYIYSTGTTTPATIYSDEGVTTKANPLTTNISGEFSFYAPDGDYDIRVVYGSTDLTRSDITIGSPVISSPTIINPTVTGGTFTSPNITTPTGIIKGDIGLGNVDNTSDATKNAASATLTNKVIDGASNTLTNISGSNVNYSQGGTGAVTTNVQTKLREFVSVKDFGAVGDGVTDDTAALETASVAAGVGGTLLIPRGMVCRVTSEVDFTTSGQRIIGYGAKVVKDAAFTGTAVIRLRAENIYIVGLEIDGTDKVADGVSATAGAADGMTLYELKLTNCLYGISANSTSRVRVEKCKVSLVANYCMRSHNIAATRSLSGLRVTDNDFDQSDQDPATSMQAVLLVRGDATYTTSDVIISNNRFIQCVDPTNSAALCCEMRYVDGGSFSHNYGKNGSMLVSVALSSNVTVDGNVSDGATFYGIEVAGISPTGCHNVVVSDNAIDGRGSLNYGVGLQGTSPSTGCSVSGNSIRGTTLYGVFSNEQWSGIDISGNRIDIDYGTGTAQFGIYLDGSATTIDHVVISGNKLNGNSQGEKAIYLRDVKYAAVTGNVCSNWTQNGVYIHSDAGTCDEISIVGNSFKGLSSTAIAKAGTLGSRVVTSANTAYRRAGTTATNDSNLESVIHDSFGTGSPEGAVTAGVGSVFHRTDGGAGTCLYVKESGTGNTGWVAK